jgi:hypothetical protein
MILLCYIILTTTEPVILKQPVCCYRYTELIGICEKRICEELQGKDPDVSMEKVSLDGSCIKK